MITNYTELQAAVASWIARDDLTPQIPTFISLFEAKANRALKCRQMETRLDVAPSAARFSPLPANYQSMRSLVLSGVDGEPRLEFLDDLQIKDYRANIGSGTGQPRYYGISGTYIELVPTPNMSYALEITYRAKITPLSEVIDSNWLLDEAPDAYLYGALLEIAPYTKDDARVTIWAAGLKTVIDGLNGVNSDSNAPEKLKE